MIVLDLGCCPHGSDSISYLAETYEPDLLLGFDPHPSCDVGTSLRGDTVVVQQRAAAWTRWGSIWFQESKTASIVSEDVKGAAELVPCFDLAEVVARLPGPLVLKMDVEGAEYVLLRRLHETKADERLDLALVEWHAEERYELRCPVKDWAR